MKPYFLIVIAALSLSACDQAPDGTYSLRQTIADAIAPSGYANGGTITPNRLPWSEPPERAAAATKG